MINFEYRNYSVRHESGIYVARPMDGDDMELSTRHAHRVLRSIDQMWDALESSQFPKWISDALRSGKSAINLDASEIADQISKSPSHLFLEEARQLLKANYVTAKELVIPPEIPPSEVDPPRKWVAVPFGSRCRCGNRLSDASVHHRG